MASYDVGSLVNLQATFTVAGALTDPTTVTCKVVDPTGTATTPTASKVSLGIWHAQVDLTGATPGLWSYRFTGIGACQAAEQATFYVESSI